jgi:diguanylate cyclase (GGDEF)-like protein
LAAQSHSTLNGASSELADIITSIGEAAYRWQLDSDALAWSANAYSVLNISNPATIASGRAFAHLAATGNAQSRYETVVNSTLRDSGTGVAYQIQYAISPSPSVTPFWVEDTGRWFAGPDGRPARAQGMLRVINERRAQQERLSYLSRYDDLTGEINRRSLTEILGTALAEATRSHASLGFLVVSVDDLARVNEAYGVTVGDEVIAACAKRLRAKVRGADCLGRLSGNKFGILLRQCAPDDLAAAAERFLAAVRDDIVRTSGGPVAVTATIGGVVAPRHGQTVPEVLARALEALTAGKAKRRGAAEIFRPNAERDAIRRENIRTSDEIIAALNERRILAAFEPIVDTVSRHPALHECLMRVRRSDGGIVTATEIVPIAERIGLVRLIDHRMLEIAVAEMAAHPDLNLSLNVSPSSTSDGSWWDTLAGLLARHPGVAQRLMIEITETAAIQDIDEACNFVGRLKALGCRIAIDDFGAGYTSFRNIRRLGVDVIKIDGSFIQNIASSPDDRSFARTLIELAHQLGLKAVAEWVQDEAAAALLAEWGCDYLQGALVGTASVAPAWSETEAAPLRSPARLTAGEGADPSGAVAR